MADEPQAQAEVAEVVAKPEVQLVNAGGKTVTVPESHVIKHNLFAAGFLTIKGAEYPEVITDAFDAYVEAEKERGKAVTSVDQSDDGSTPKQNTVKINGKKGVNANAAKNDPTEKAGVTQNGKPVSDKKRLSGVLGSTPAGNDGDAKTAPVDEGNDGSKVKVNKTKDSSDDADTEAGDEPKANETKSSDPNYHNADDGLELPTVDASKLADMDNISAKTADDAEVETDEGDDDAGDANDDPKPSDPFIVDGVTYQRTVSESGKVTHFADKKITSAAKYDAALAKRA